MDNNEIKAKEINSLITTLIELSNNLSSLENELLEKLNNNDEEAHRILTKYVVEVTQRFKIIGTEINTIGGGEEDGFSIMQYALSQVPGSHTVISFAWNGIGKWMH